MADQATVHEADGSIGSRLLIVEITKTSFVTIRLLAAPRALNNFNDGFWGFAALHPRLYAAVRSAD